MSFSVGRFGIDVAATNPISWSESGEVVSISGNQLAGSKAAAQALRQQLMGYVSNEFERFVPVVWGSDATRTGFYRVDSARADVAAEFTSGYFPFQIGLSRVQAYAAPSSETIVRGAGRVGKPAGVSSVLWWSQGGAATGDMTGLFTSAVAVPSERGSPIQFSGPMPTLLSAQWGSGSLLNPARWYDGAATINQTSSVIVGRQASVDPNWSIDNGNLAVAPTTTGFVLASSYGSGFSLPTAITVTAGATATFGTFLAAPVVLRNSPEQVTVRVVPSLTLNATPTVPAQVTVDLTLRRGAKFVEIVIAGTVQSVPYTVGHSAATAMAHVDTNLGGNVDTAYDASGNKLVLMQGTLGTGGNVTVAEDLTNGNVSKLWGAPLTSYKAQFGVGLVNSGDPQLATVSSPTALRDRYYGSLTELTTVIAP